MNSQELIDALNQLTVEFGKPLPVMCQCDHGQWPENVYSIQVLYRLRGADNDSDFQCGYLDDLREDWSIDDLEPFVMIN